MSVYLPIEDSHNEWQIGETRICRAYQATEDVYEVAHSAPNTTHQILNGSQFASAFTADDAVIDAYLFEFTMDEDGALVADLTKKYVAVPCVTEVV